LQVNSVAARGGVVAMGVQGPAKTDPGTIVFYRATTLHHVSNVTVGALPDMVTFTPDGKTLLVANEGEPNDAYTVDPRTMRWQSWTWRPRRCNSSCRSWGSSALAVSWCTT
jgi:DNA-binding beta-propeller fold protein YncE